MPEWILLLKDQWRLQWPYKGGLGVVHKNMSIQAQAGEVANVKSVVVPAGATKAAVDDNNRLLVAAAVGVTSDDTFERAEALLKARRRCYRY